MQKCSPLAIGGVKRRAETASQREFKGLPKIREAQRLDPEFPIKAVPWRYVRGGEPLRDLHAHDCLELGICHSGAGLFLIDRRIFNFAAGACVVLPPRTFHRAVCESESSEWTFVFLEPAGLLRGLGVAPELLRVEAFGGLHFPYMHLPESADIGTNGLLQELVAELRQQAPWHSDAIRGLVRTLLARFQRLPGRRRICRDQTTDPLTRLAPALELLASEVGRDWSMREVAAACHMSAPTFRRHFQRGLGCSPKRYQLRLRIHAAAARLSQTDQKVIALALDCGFNSLSAFNRNFKAILGVSPQAWRAGKRARS